MVCPHIKSVSKSLVRLENGVSTKIKESIKQTLSTGDERVSGMCELVDYGVEESLDGRSVIGLRESSCDHVFQIRFALGSSFRSGMGERPTFIPEESRDPFQLVLIPIVSPRR